LLSRRVIGRRNPMPIKAARLMMALKLAGLARDASGVRSCRSQAPDRLEPKEERV
jgi:histidine ammonia-lyase